MNPEIVSLAISLGVVVASVWDGYFVQRLKTGRIYPGQS